MFQIIPNNIPIPINKLTLTATNITPGPMGSNSCPISQGILIAPKLIPVKKIPMVCPLMVMCLPANDSIDGKIAAIDKPNHKLPAHTMTLEVGISNMGTTANAADSKHNPNSLEGFSRAAKGIVNNLPKVYVPQKAEVR
jgi:hypothetical protein